MALMDNFCSSSVGAEGFCFMTSDNHIPEMQCLEEQALWSFSTGPAVAESIGAAQSPPSKRCPGFYFQSNVYQSFQGSDSVGVAQKLSQRLY